MINYFREFIEHLKKGEPTFTGIPNQTNVLDEGKILSYKYKQLKTYRLTVIYIILSFITSLFFVYVSAGLFVNAFKDSSEIVIVTKHILKIIIISMFVSMYLIFKVKGKSFAGIKLGRKKRVNLVSGSGNIDDNGFENKDVMEVYEHSVIPELINSVFISSILVLITLPNKVSAFGYIILMLFMYCLYRVISYIFWIFIEFCNLSDLDVSKFHYYYNNPSSKVNEIDKNLYLEYFELIKQWSENGYSNAYRSDGSYHKQKDYKTIVLMIRDKELDKVFKVEYLVVNSRLFPYETVWEYPSKNLNEMIIDL